MSHGLVVALKGEARAMLGRGRWDKAAATGKGALPLKRIELADGGELLVTLSGVGREKAAAGAGFLVGKGVSSLINIGLAGGLSPQVKAGEIILASTIIDEGQGEYGVNPGALEFASVVLGDNGLRSRQGLIVSTETALLDAAAKSALYKKTGALAVDMESAGAGAVAAEKGLPLFVLRVVCDEAGEGISSDLYECLGSDGGVRPGRILKGSFKRPSMVAEMMALRRAYNLALLSMGRAWQALLRGGLLGVLISGKGPR